MVGMTPAGKETSTHAKAGALLHLRSDKGVPVYGRSRDAAVRPYFPISASSRAAQSLKYFSGDAEAF